VYKGEGLYSNALLVSDGGKFSYGTLCQQFSTIT
jgi:hypothetical protein